MLTRNDAMGYPVGDCPSFTRTCPGQYEHGATQRLSHRALLIIESCKDVR